MIHTPGHTRDSMCLQVDDRLFTGDTLLIGATGRTDLPTGDPEALHDSLFQGILRLDTTLKVYPAHDYKGSGHSTIARELADNPRLAESRPRRVRRHDAQSQSDDADAHHRGPPQQHERWQDCRATAR